MKIEPRSHRMKKFFLVIILSVILTACSSTTSNNASNSRRTPVAQLPVQSTQALAAAQSTVADASTATPVPATPTSSLSVTPSATLDPSMPTGLDVVTRTSYNMNNGLYIVGELLNNTSAPMGNIKITATYYYQSLGKYQVLGTLDGTTLLSVIPSGGKAPFIVGPYAVPGGKPGPVTWYDLHEQGETATLPNQDLT